MRRSSIPFRASSASRPRARIPSASFSLMSLAFLVSIFAGWHLSQTSYCHVLWIVHGPGLSRVDIERDLNRAASESDAFKKSCGSSKPNWKEYKLPDTWKGDTSQEVEAARQDVENMIYELGKTSPFSNLFVGGSNLAGGLAIHTSFFFPLKLAGVIAIDPVLSPDTRRLLGVSQQTLPAVGGFGQTKSHGYYTTRQSKAPPLPNMISGNYGSAEVAATMGDIFGISKCAVILVTDELGVEAKISRALLKAFGENKDITARCGASPLYSVLVAKKSDPEYTSRIGKGLKDKLEAASSLHIPDIRKFILGQGIGRHAIDECQSIAPTLFKDVTVVTVEAYKPYWFSTNVPTVAQGVMKTIVRALSSPPAYPSLIFAYKGLEEAAKGYALEHKSNISSQAKTTAEAKLGRVNSISVILPDIGEADPPDNGRGTPLWMVKVYDLASFMAPLSSVTFVTQLRYSEAMIGGVADNLAGTFVYQIDTAVKSKTYKDQDKQMSVVYKTENDMMSELPNDLVGYMSRSVSSTPKSEVSGAKGSDLAVAEDSFQGGSSSFRNKGRGQILEYLQVLKSLQTDVEE